MCWSSSMLLVTSRRQLMASRLAAELSNTQPAELDEAAGAHTTSSGPTSTCSLLAVPAVSVASRDATDAFRREPTCSQQASETRVSKLWLM